MAHPDDCELGRSNGVSMRVLLHVGLTIAWLPQLIPWMLTFELETIYWFIPAVAGALGIGLVTLSFGRIARRERIHHDVPVLIGYLIASALIPAVICSLLISVCDVPGTWPADTCMSLGSVCVNFIWGAALVLPTRFAVNRVYHDAEDRGVYCPHCGYDLRGATIVTRCSECGGAL